MSDWKARRFWKSVEVGEAEGGFAVTLDGRSVRTPAKAPLVVPSRAYAEAVAAEWDAQEKEVNPETMPITRSANAAIDKLSIQAAEVVAMLAEYGRTDLVCYRAAHPQALTERQAQQWDPVLDWAAQKFGGRLYPTEGVIPVAQDEGVIQAMAARMAACSAFELAAVHDLVTISGSLVLGLGVVEGHLDPLKAWELSRLDETWQEEQWGVDEEASAEAEFKKTEFTRAKFIFDLSQA